MKLKKIFCCLLAKVFSRENELFFWFAKVFSAKFVPKFTKRESFCQKFRVFFGTRKFLPAKVSAFKVALSFKFRSWYSGQQTFHKQVSFWKKKINSSVSSFFLFFDIFKTFTKIMIFEKTLLICCILFTLNKENNWISIEKSDGKNRKSWTRPTL